jgi:hypothetical protein
MFLIIPKLHMLHKVDFMIWIKFSCCSLFYISNH